MILRCDLTKQYKRFESKFTAALKNVFSSGQYILGKECKLFEKEFASYCGTKFGIAVANGTEALYLSLRALGIGKGDEVITSPFTPIPTVSSIVMSGARPIFVDINRGNFLMDIGRIKDAVTTKTKAIMPVHLFGDVVDMDSLLPAAKELGLFLVEDACQAHGSLYKGKKAGSWGKFGCFSFYPTKNLGGYGDGGLIITNDFDLAKKLKLLRDYGKDSLFTAIIPGINSRLDELQAAILRIKLRFLDELNEARKKIARHYFLRLKNTPLELPLEARDTHPNYHIFNVKCVKRRDALRLYLEKNKIQTNIYYPVPMHLQKAYRYLGYKKGDFPFSEKACEEILALPMYPELEQGVVEFVCDKINKFFR